MLRTNRTNDTNSIHGSNRSNRSNRINGAQRTVGAIGALRAIAIVVAAFAVPTISFAQSSAGLTRDQVRAELIRVENAGYMPGADDSQYPQNIQNAEAKIAAEQNASPATASVGTPLPIAMGMPADGQAPTESPTRSSMPISMASEHSLPAHASMPMDCVGPVEFCNLYFGS